MRELGPYIVTSWHGHRNSDAIPDAVSDVWREKFMPQRGRPGGQGQSNVDLAVLDAGGKLVDSFDGFHTDSQGEVREPLAEYSVRKLRGLAARLGLPDKRRASRVVTLPPLKEGKGMRDFVTLDDDRMTAYQAPIVENVALEADDWKPLAYPSENERVVDAGALKKWLREIYPSGIMERVDPATKRVYAIRAAEGSLSLVPAGDHEDYRFAILSGKVTLTDEGPDDFSYTGDLQAVILYGPPEDGVLSVRGGFEGTYPRRDPRQKRPRILPLRAVFESLPE